MKKVLRAATSFSLAALLTFSSLMSPVVAAYGLNEAHPAEAVTDVASAGDDGVAARDDYAESSEATVDQSPVEGDIEAIDSLSQGAAESDAKTEQQVDSVESDFQYVYLAYPSLPSGSNQVIAFATPNDGEVLSSATLGYVSANGVKGSVDASATADNSAAFTFGAKLEANTYFLTSISYYLEGDGTEHKIDLSDRDYSFTVADSSMNPEGTSVYYADGDGNAVEAQSIQQALECADSQDGVSTYAARSARNVSVIALDAGHGGSDPGAQGNGKSEADLTWKIVTACKNKLEAYGFKVVLAREQYGNYSGNDFLYRVQRCIDQGAQAFVSFHINSGPSAAHGAEVYAPTSNGSDYTQVSVELANKVMNNLAAMGLTYRGVFQMQVGDEFAVIRCAREQGIPGILIEHGFISNSGDVANYFSDDGCRRLGEADAAAIIAQFPKSSWYSGSLTVKKNARHIDLVTKFSGGNPTNACYMVKSSSGRVDWVQGYDQHNNSWTGSFDLDAEYGVFQVEAYVTCDGETFRVDSKSFGDNRASTNAAISGNIVDVTSSNWAVDPAYVSYEVISPSGTSYWFSGCKSGNEWGCQFNLDDMDSLFGKTTVRPWCTLNGASAFPCGSTNYEFELPDVSLSLSDEGGSLSATATGLKPAPSNACLQVVAPSGAERWYQLYRQADGSWTGAAPAAADLGEFGEYRATVWATYGSQSRGWATAKASVARPDVSLSLSDEGGSLSATATGLKPAPSNACLQVVAPSGAERWYQLYRQADGSWTGAAPAAADLGEFGEYRATVWATYGSQSRGWASRSCLIESGFHKIMSSGTFIQEKMVSAFVRSGSIFPSNVYAKFGAASIYDFVSIIAEEAAYEGVDPYVVFAQAMVETGWLKFGGQVQPDQCNFAGIGALDGGASGASFNSFGNDSVRMGIRAQVQHLKAYASFGPLNRECVDPRFYLVKRGSVTTVGELSGKWASDLDYGNKISKVILSIK